MKKFRRTPALLISLILAFALFVQPLSAVSAASAGAERMLGDVNNDARINVRDVTQIQRQLAQKESLDRASLAAADIDGDGEVTIDDATTLQIFLTERQVPYPVGEPVTLYAKEKRGAIDALSARLAAAKSAAGSKPVLLRSYDTDKRELSLTAYTYDNALAAMAFISENRTADAEEILDAFVYAVAHDRCKPGRIRNAYASDTVYWKNNGQDSVKLPGWYNYGWCEDAQQVGSNTGNTSYAALAMLQYDKAYNTSKYLDTAKTLMDWVISDCTGSGSGFIGGYNGWPEEEGKAVLLTYKSTENNIDAYAAFRQLYAVTGEEKYRIAAESALAFIRSMYNASGGYFYTGTAADGVTPNKSVIVLDVQVWNALALGGEFAPYEDSLTLVRNMKTAEGAYPFCQENKNGGFWCEGTAFTALMFRQRGDSQSFTGAMDALCAVQLDNGIFPAATVDNLSTGILLDSGMPWEYNQDPHIAPAAWFVMAANGFNPYDFT